MMFIIGDSHTLALQAGLRDEHLKKSLPDDALKNIKAAQLDHGYKFATRFFNERPDGFALNFKDSRAQDVFSKLCGDTPPNCILKGDTRNFVFCLGFHPSGSILPKFWVKHTCQSTVETKHYISNHAFDAFVTDYTQEIMVFFDKLMAYGVPFSVAACPPLPKSYFADYVTTEVLNKEAFSAEELIYTHNRFRDAFAKILNQKGIQYHLPPNAVYTEEGFLSNEFTANNVPGDYHANAHYGALMVEKIYSELHANRPLNEDSKNESSFVGDAFALLRKVKFEGGRFFPEGVALIEGQHCVDYKNISHILIFKNERMQYEIPLAKTHAPNLTKEFNQQLPPIIYDKAWFCTYQHLGLDVTHIPFGDYELSVEINVNGVKKSKTLTSDVLNLTAEHVNEGVRYNVYSDSQQMVRFKKERDLGGSHNKQATNQIQKVAIIGSCVTRDNFNSLFNKDYRLFFECTHVQYQSSILSLMSPALQITDEDCLPLKGHDQMHVKRDFEKSLLAELKENPPDILIIDLFSDSRFDCLEFGDSLVTNNEWKLWNTSLYQKVKTNSIVGVNRNPDVFMPLFLDAVDRLKVFCDEHLKGVTLILNQARGVYTWDEDGATKQFNHDLVSRVNRNWDVLDAILIEKMSPQLINPMVAGLKGDVKHPWGVGWVHYTKGFYQEFLSCLIEISRQQNK